MLLRFIYTFVLTLAAPFFLFSLLKKREGKPSVGSRWKEYFGITPKPQAESAPIWIHAVSVGETIAATPIIKALKAKHPDLAIILTTTTTTGAEQAAKLGDLVEHRYMPLDFPFAIKGFLKATSPSQLLIMETELWPNTLNTVNKAGLLITVLNARLSERSCLRYQKVQPVFNQLSKNLTQILCQHADDAERFIRLGVTDEKVQVTGSVKFDISVSDDIKRKGEILRSFLGKNRPIWIAASTHQGEDEKILEAHQALLAHFPEALLVLVPRHPERFQQVEKLSAQSGLQTISRTSKQAVTPETQVYLGDTMGEMMLLLGAADICFMGGSLLGDKVGGHNLLEPAALGKALINGPSYFNFSDIANQLITANALQLCNNTSELFVTLTKLFEDRTIREQMGKAALEVVQKNRGAIKKTIDSIHI
ncbi:lipid IV(A) 3-deoxy-D-manno-octulosonic acid transferase [Vibrio sp. JC009]|uniref:lipid IV(A) 3-deoxy-D-manno-octulosonic acid transferase n=1 Tax=Vibrio sp. JC009 TaxID=2912314 RepID=UPI0023AFE291|nr:lipid IV(A) 3-deoxy-D-manno-octulosonic acid transferase [Vibrio sp. JC009]WED21982.1 lipid IV(A) 3-deoxy-D-manno-octulosonic acid transferase [Vibrio sp. JC009]